MITINPEVKSKIIYELFLRSKNRFLMTDVHEPDVRSYNMSRIRNKDTQPELIVRRFLFRNGFRYKLHVKHLPGKPDIVLPKYKTILMIHGCFWHGHENCRYFSTPGTRREWWLEKIAKTKKRDHVNIKKLTEMGWKVITIWECEIKTDSNIKLTEILTAIKFFV